jgi:hypothetical protein
VIPAGQGTNNEGGGDQGNNDVQGGVIVLLPLGIGLAANQFRRRLTSSLGRRMAGSLHR